MDPGMLTLFGVVLAAHEALHLWIHKQTRKLGKDAVEHLKKNVAMGFQGSTEAMNKSNEERGELKEQYVRKDYHALLCKDATASLEKHMTAEFTALKEDITEQITDLRDIIKKNGSGK